jgi:sirohydrochlorin cobaltochelatase
LLPAAGSATSAGVTTDALGDTTLLVLAHGSTLNDGSELPAKAHAAALGCRGLFAEVRACFWKQEPRVARALSEIRTPRVVIVPFFVGAGYFVEEVIPEALGLKTPGQPAFPRVQRREGAICHYAEPVGTHPGVTAVLLRRAREVVLRHPFPRCPAPGETTLVVAGHGTERSRISRLAVDREVARIRGLGRYAQVEPAFMEEEPRLTDCLLATGSRHVVVVPFFMSDGLHVREDIPVLLGESQALVAERLALGKAPWRNPTGRQGKLVWYAPGLGSDPLMAELILERARAALAWPVGASPRTGGQ